MIKKTTLDRIKKFIKDRDWSKFHSPANLSKSISIEAAELLECFQWDEENYNLDNVKDEIADVLIYTYDLMEVLKLDPDKLINDKMTKNEKKYPVEKSK